MAAICSTLAYHWLQSVVLWLLIGCNLFYSGSSLAAICSTLTFHWLQSDLCWLIIGCNMLYSGFSLAAICSTLAPHWLESVLIWLLIGCIMFYYGSLLAAICSTLAPHWLHYVLLWLLIGCTLFCSALVTLQFVFVAKLSSDYILTWFSPLPRYNFVTSPSWYKVAWANHQKVRPHLFSTLPSRKLFNPVMLAHKGGMIYYFTTIYYSFTINEHLRKRKFEIKKCWNILF